MPLRAYKTPSGWYHIRGTHHGVRVDESAGTRDRASAEAVREKLERQIFEQVVLGKKPRRIFAEAALGYMEGGGERVHLAKILQAQIAIDGRKAAFADLELDVIDQAAIDRLAALLYPAGKASTRNRRVYTPVSAVLNWAAEQRAWGYVHGRIRRPKQPKGRIDWRTPGEIAWWLQRAGHLSPLLTAYVGCGARASELIELDWADVSPDTRSFTLWEDATKSGAARTVDLQPKVRAAFPARAKGRVFRNGAGAPWHAYDAVNLALRRITHREALAVARPVEADEIATLRALARSRGAPPAQRLEATQAARALLQAVAEREGVPHLHLHVLRHTWATWAYAVTRDMPWVMAQGGWASEKLALRYIHVGTPDLGDLALAEGWIMRPLRNAA